MEMEHLPTLQTFCNRSILDTKMNTLLYCCKQLTFNGINIVFYILLQNYKKFVKNKREGKRGKAGSGGTGCIGSEWPCGRAYRITNPKRIKKCLRENL